MRCPKCESKQDFVVDSLANLDGSHIRRRRECYSCNHRFSTYETIDPEEHQQNGAEPMVTVPKAFIQELKLLIAQVEPRPVYDPVHSK